MCPEVIIVLGEDLTRFRDASKDNYRFLRNYAWSEKVERLGFDEVSICNQLHRLFCAHELISVRFSWMLLIWSITILIFSILVI